MAEEELWTVRIMWSVHRVYCRDAPGDDLFFSSRYYATGSSGSTEQGAKSSATNGQLTKNLAMTIPSPHQSR